MGTRQGRWHQGRPSLHDIMSPLDGTNYSSVIRSVYSIVYSGIARRVSAGVVNFRCA